VTADELRASFAAHGYVADDDTATAFELMLALRKPLLVEGPAGVGKTESAKVLAEVLGTRLIRLQCYEGLDAASALYEWNYPKQLLHIRLTEHAGESPDAREAEIFGERFLLRRPLLEAIVQDRAPVLLIDEVDRADEAFEAFLLELLGEFQVTIPELGTIRARERPAVVLTSNRTRDLSDALRRRCLYLWIDYPALGEEIAILRTRLPGISERLAAQIARFMAWLREQPFQKVPGVAESLDWAMALVELHRDALDVATLERTAGVILKVRDDWELLQAQRMRWEPLLTARAEESTRAPFGESSQASTRAAVPDSDYGVGTVRANRA
jgi:MoxR-like ATPase